MSLFRSYVAYRLRNIAVLNGVRVADAERLKGHRIFSDGFGLSPSVGKNIPSARGHRKDGQASGTSRMRSSVGGRGQSRSFQSSSNSSSSSAAANDQRHADFSNAYTSMLVEQAVEIEDKLRSVDKMWPGLVQRVIKETLEGVARRREVVAAAHKNSAKSTVKDGKIKTVGSSRGAKRSSITSASRDRSSKRGGSLFS